MSACRGVLRCEADAEDAFQATFFVLARKAQSIERGSRLAAWLHRAALRISLRAAKRKHKLQAQSLRAEIDPPSAELTRVSTRATMHAVHEAIGKLAEPLRSTVLLTYFEGLTREEAAKRLDVTSNIIQARLKKARGQLRRSLALKSVSLAGLSLLAMHATSDMAKGSIVSLCEACTETVLHVQAGLAATAKASAGVPVALAQGVIRSMTITTSLRHAFVVLLAVSCGWMAFGPASPPSASTAMAQAVPIELADVEWEDVEQGSAMMFVSIAEEHVAGHSAPSIQDAESTQDNSSSQFRLPQQDFQQKLLSSIVDAIAQALRRKNEVDDMQQLRDIGIAVHNFHDVNRLSPPGNFPRTDDEARQPLLSWRVYLLPYLGEEGQALYEEFHLDEPWDSDHNKQLLSEMPHIYALSDGLPAGHSDVLSPYGPDTIFGGDSSKSFAPISDGIALTAMFFEAAPGHSVPWTKPMDFEFDPEEADALKRFGKSGSDSFLVVWGDAGVSALPKTSTAEFVASIINPTDKQPTLEEIGR